MRLGLRVVIALWFVAWAGLLVVGAGTLVTRAALHVANRPPAGPAAGPPPVAAVPAPPRFVQGADPTPQEERDIRAALDALNDAVRRADAAAAADCFDPRRIFQEMVAT